MGRASGLSCRGALHLISLHVEADAVDYAANHEGCTCDCSASRVALVFLRHYHLGEDDHNDGKEQVDQDLESKEPRMDGLSRYLVVNCAEAATACG